MSADLHINFAGVDFQNPVLTASGTFGSGMEYSDFYDISKLGAVITKGVSVTPWEGNPVPRVAETPSGMLNAIGLQNPGIDLFLKRDSAFLEENNIPYVINVCGHTKEEYMEAVERLSDTKAKALEINISCPNVKAGGITFGTTAEGVEDITKAVKSVAKKPIIMKLSPNVTSIAEIAKAAEAGGADAVSLINTITGMKIDIRRRTFVLKNKTGGLSGPAIHPVAVRMVYEVHNAVKIPVLGMGGIASAEDAIEMMLAGASLVAVGTSNFFNPTGTLDIIDGIQKYLDENGFSSVSDIIGAVN